MIVKDRIMAHNGNHQVLHWFENGYGASVIQGPYTYGGDEGLFEMAVVHFEGDEYALVYDTPVTDDVLGYLTPSEVEHYLAKVERLEPRS